MTTKERKRRAVIIENLIGMIMATKGYDRSWANQLAIQALDMAESGLTPLNLDQIINRLPAAGSGGLWLI